jgi:cyanophycinase
LLALVGSGEYLPEMQTVDRFLLEGLGSQPNVVCLPTAAGTEGQERIAYWANLGENYFRSLIVDVATVPVINRQDAQNPNLAEQVRTANFVYLSGGKPEYLLATLKGSLVWGAIQDVVARGGVLAGCSAGAMVLGEKIPGFPGWRNAFNLLEGAVIIPHFDEMPPWLVGVLRRWMGRESRMVGVPGFTALVVNGKSCQVLGKGNVTLWDRYGKRDFPPGEPLVW